MPDIISQVALSNTFNEFRTTFNAAANVVNALTDDGANVSVDLVSSDRIVVGTMRQTSLTSGRVMVAGTSGEIGDDANLTFNTSTNVLTADGAVVSANLYSTDSLEVEGDVTLGTGSNTAIFHSANGSIQLTGDGTGGSGRVTGYDGHFTKHVVGGPGDVETWTTAKGQSDETHHIAAIGDQDASVDMVVVNQSAGANAYAEFIAINDSGDIENGWVSTGINSSNYGEGAYAVTKADDAYILYQAPSGTIHSGDLVIGTGGNGTGNKIIFSANGFDDPANNTQMVITPGQNIHIEIDTESSNTLTGALTVNGGLGLTGNLNVGGNVSITGTITLGGGGNTVSTDSLSVDNPIIYLGANNAADALDLGLIGTYNDGSEKYAGFIRDASDGVVKFFANTSIFPENTVDFSDADITYSSIKVGSLEANTTTASTDTITGSIVAKGGVGIAGAVNAGGAITTTDTTASSSTSTGSIIAGGGLGVAGAAYIGGDLNVTGLATFTGGIRAQELIEDLVDSAQSSNVIGLDYSAGNVFYQSGTAFSANFTVNVTNAPTTDGRAFTIALMVPQGATGRIPSTLNVNGSAVTIRWVGGSAPTPTSSSGKIDIFTFTIYRRSSTFYSLVSSSLNY